MTPCPHCQGDHPGHECPSLDASWDAPTALTAVPQAGELQPRMLLGDYELVQKIGEGGMGAVWEGHHRMLGRRVAIKVMHAVSPQLSARFLKEAQATSRIRHPNVVDVQTFGQLPDGRSYLVMEFLDGESLEKLLARGPLGVDHALPILDGVLAGLKASHDKGIIHRDLKPANIWLLPVDEGFAMDARAVKILDFGLAKLVDQPDGRNSVMTRAGTPIGTPSYMSPEQCRGVADLDARSDVYAVGVLLYQIFSGRLPFSGESYVDVINQHLQAAPPSLARAVGMPAGLEAVILRALSKRREDRYAGASELREALHRSGAAGWAPKGGVPLATDPTPLALSVEQVEAAIRQHEARSAPPGDLLARAVLFGDLTVAPKLRDGTLTIEMQGELDAEDAALSLAAHFETLSDAIAGANVDRVVVDIEALQFLSSAAFGALAGWLSSLRALRLAPTTLRYTAGVRWQSTSAATLQRADPTLALETAG